jgi:hypothetical protein
MCPPPLDLLYGAPPGLHFYGAPQLIRSLESSVPVLRQCFLVLATSLLVGVLLLSLAGHRPTFLQRGSESLVLDAAVPGFLDRSREMMPTDQWNELLEQAGNHGLSKEQLREAGRNLGIDGGQAREAFAEWAHALPGYDPAAQVVSASRAEDHRVQGVDVIAIGATAFVGMLPVLTALAVGRRLRRHSAEHRSSRGLFHPKVTML